MSEATKHWLDIFAAFATLISTIVTPIIGGITAVLGMLWYGIRIYEWLKGRKDGYLRDD